MSWTIKENGPRLTDDIAYGRLCMICQEMAFGDLQLFGRLICYRCERAIMQLDVADERYWDLVVQIKYVWKDVMQVAENSVKM